MIKINLTTPENFWRIFFSSLCFCMWEWPKFMLAFRRWKAGFSGEWKWNLCWEANLRVFATGEAPLWVQQLTKVRFLRLAVGLEARPVPDIELSLVAHHLVFLVSSDDLADERLLDFQSTVRLFLWQNDFVRCRRRHYHDAVLAGLKNVGDDQLVVVFQQSLARLRNEQRIISLQFEAYDKAFRDPRRHERL